MAAGTHDARGRQGRTPWAHRPRSDRIVLLVGALAWLVAMVRHVPCLVNPGLQYRAMCYSDITALWTARGIDLGLLPYLQVDLEYPVLTAAFIVTARALVGWVDPGMRVAAYFVVSAVGLGLCFGWVLRSHLSLGRRGALLLACSPLIVTSALINWDMITVALTSAALLAWVSRRPGLAGVLIGLGLSAKFYPALLAVGLVALCVRERSVRRASALIGGVAASFAVINLPVVLAAPEGWLHQWTFHAGRGADLGSVFYALQVLGLPVAASAGWSRGLLIAGALAVFVLVLAARRTPSAGSVAFVLVAWFCTVNVVYSPQYVVWVLPLLLLAWPDGHHLGRFTVVEIVYWAVVWVFLSGPYVVGGPLALWYALTVLLRAGNAVTLIVATVAAWFAPDPQPSTPEVAHAHR